MSSTGCLSSNQEAVINVEMRGHESLSEGELIRKKSFWFRKDLGESNLWHDWDKLAISNHWMATFVKMSEPLRMPLIMGGKRGWRNWPFLAGKSTVIKSWIDWSNSCIDSAQLQLLTRILDLMVEVELFAIILARSALVTFRSSPCLISSS